MLQLFEQAPTDNTSEGKKGIPVQVRHPEQLRSIMTGKEVPDMNFPPQPGQITRFIYPPNRRRPDAIFVDFSSTHFVSGISYAAFDIDSAEITTNGTVVVDCAKVKAAQGSLKL